MAGQCAVASLVGVAVKSSRPTFTAGSGGRHGGFCYLLTEGNHSGNHSVATVAFMTASDLHLHLHHRPGLAVRPGESNPAGMLGRVLLLLVALAVVAVLGLTWWLV